MKSSIVSSVCRDSSCWSDVVSKNEKRKKNIFRCVDVEREFLCLLGRTDFNDELSRMLLFQYEVLFVFREVISKHINK